MSNKDQNSRIGVLMPVYNAAPFLKEAIESILNQTYKHFDFYIINDGSTDESQEIINSCDDKRIRCLKNDKNRGLVYTLNRGLDEIKNEFIARMDADDIAYPERFQKQLEFMDANPEVMASGTQIQYFGQSEAKSEFPLTHDELKAKLITAHGIVHPTSIYRSKFITENKIKYDEKYFFIEDYDFWMKVAKHGRLGNLPQILLKYRWEGQNVTAKNWNVREERYKLIYKQILEELEIPLTEENLQCHMELAFNTEGIGDISDLYQHKKNLFNQNKQIKIYPEKELKKELEILWSKLFFKSYEKSFSQMLKYWWLSRKIKPSQFRYFLGSIISRKKG